MMASADLRGYLTLVPRGFESTTSSIIKEALASFECILQFGDENEDIPKLTEQLRKQQRKKRSKILRRKKWVEGDNGESAEAEDTDEGALIMGTQQLSNGEEVSLGYHNGRTVLSVPGAVEGLVPLKFYTNAPPGIVAAIRGMGCGPLLALAVTSYDAARCANDTKDQVANSSASKLDTSGTTRLSQILQYNQTLDDAAAAVSSFIHGQDDYTSNFRRALSLWFDHANEVWFAGNGSFYGLDLERDGKEGREYHQEDLRRKFQGYLPFTFRVSCLRSNTKKYGWKREDIIPKLANIIVPVGELSGADLSLAEKSRGSTETKKVQNGITWKVDLKHYDFEVLALFHHNTVTVAVPLRPYQHLSTKNYSSGRLPPDVAPPYIAGSIANSVSVVRLRPSTAAQLLHLANVQAGDVVMDPCGGVGTIPIEASLCYKRCLAFGGDIVLTEGFVDIASRYLAAAKSQQRVQTQQEPLVFGGVSDVLAWDAALLPIRDSCVDCIVSDLPFGVKCLSSNKLSRFLPLLMSECARVLRPGVGRIVFLCGSYQGVLDATAAQNKVANSSVFALPCHSVFPVNIGGITAWVVIIKRDSGKAVRIENQNDRARKIASIRTCNRATDGFGAEPTGQNKQQTGKAKKRRVQS